MKLYQLRNIIRKVLISEGLADRSLMKGEIAALEEVAEQFLKAAKSNNPDPKALTSVIYNFYTKNHEYRDLALRIATAPPEKKKRYVTWYDSVKSTTKASGDKRGWDYSDSGAWTQYTKPFQGQADSGNFKRYITFDRGEDLKAFYENYGKIPYLLAYLNEVTTVGKVSFKIATHFSAAIEHKDNVVIHYKNRQDEVAVEDAVKKVGFKMTDRSAIGRTDTGVDAESTSDSDIVAGLAAKTMLRPDNAPKFLKYLSEPKDSHEYKQGLSLINKYLSDQMELSSHRSKRTLFHITIVQKFS